MISNRQNRFRYLLSKTKDTNILNKTLIIYLHIVCYVLSAFLAFAQQEPDVKTLEYNFNLLSSEQAQPTSLDIMILFDHSKSMKINDPERIRMNAVLYLLDYLMANAQYYQINCRLGFVCFAGKPIHTLPLSLLTKTTRKAIKLYLLEEESYSWTDFQEPIQYAYQELKAKSFGSENKRLIILFTDGHPQLDEKPMTNNELNDYFKQLIPVISDLQTNQVPLFVLGIGDAHGDMTNWSQLITKDQYVKISDVNEISKHFHRIITKLIDFFRLYDGNIIETNKVKFEVEPLLERISFSFMLSQPDIKINVKTPQGFSIEPAYGNNGEEYHALFTIRNPSDGIWEIFKTGMGHVQYWFDAQYPMVQIKLDSTYPYTGYPFKIEAHLFRNGSQVNRSDIIITAQIETPNDKSKKLALYNSGDGIFRGEFKYTQTHGEYHVSAKARWINTSKLLNVRKVNDRITVLPLPEPKQNQNVWKNLSLFSVGIICLLLFLLVCLLFERKSNKFKSHQSELNNEEELDKFKSLQDDLSKNRDFRDKAIKANNKQIVLEDCKKSLDKLVETHQSSIIDSAIIIFKDVFEVIDETDVNDIIKDFLINAKSKAQKEAFTIYFKQYLVESKEDEIVNYLYHINFNKNILKELSKESRDGRSIRLEHIYFLKRLDVNDINKFIYAIEALFKFKVKAKQFNSKELAEILTEISQSFLKFHKKQCKHAEHASELYESLSKLVQKPLYPGDQVFSKNDRHPYFIKLESYVKQLFHFKSTLEELLVNFKSFKSNFKELNKVELKVFVLIRYYWKKQVREKFQLAKDLNVNKVNIELAPELSIMPTSENELYRILIDNLGQIPIYDIKIMEIDDTQEQNSEYHISPQYKKIPLIQPCRNELIVLNVIKNTPKTINTKFTISFNTWFQKNITQSIDIILPEIECITKPLQNPFIVMKPIPKTQQYECFFNINSRKDALSQLKKKLKSFQLINLYGLRRIGKTSLINHFQHQNSSKIFPIYIDCSILNILSPYNKDEILRTLFDHIIYKEIQKQYDNYVKPGLDINDKNNYYSKLVKSYAKFLRKKNKDLVIILDDAHHLYNPTIIPEKEKHSLLSYLRYLVIEAEKIDADYSILLITEKSITGFTEERYKFIPHIISLSLLNFEEVCELSQMYNIMTFSSLALSYMMRFSGGYTSVIQAICDSLIRYCNDTKCSTVFLKDIKKVIHMIVTTSAFRPNLEILLNGLTDDEQNWLSQLVQKNKIDTFTMYINIQEDEIGELEKKIIDNLRYKQVIVSNQVICDTDTESKTLYKLRIGIFKTLIEEWNIGYTSHES